MGIKKSAKKANFPKSIEKQYDLIGSDYISEKNKFYSAVPDFGKKFIFEQLSNLDGKEGVEVGCGGGGDLKDYLTHGSKNIIGVDPSVVMVREARKLLGKNFVEIGSWTRLPFINNSKDFLIGRFSLNYVEAIDAAYKEAARVLKTGGVLLLVLPHSSADKIIINRKGKKYIQTSIFGGKMTVTYPLHSMDEYFSDTFNDLFELVEKKEYASPERSATGIPDSFVMMARKR